MSRSASRRSSDVRTDKSLPPMLSDNTSATTQESLPPSAVPWTWRLALFLWVTSFVFLFLYEWLAGILKAWMR